MSGKSALVLGATGATGKHVLRELLQSGEYTRVGEFGRRVTSLDQLSSLQNARVDKLQQKTIDFEKIDEAGLKEGKWDVVLITFVSHPRSLLSPLPHTPAFPLPCSVSERY